MNAALATYSIPAIVTTHSFMALWLGAVVLAIIASLMLGLELKILLKPLFLVTGLLIYYIGFKFVGDGIHSLQVIGIVSATPVNFLPASKDLGLYSTWETILPQLALLIAARVTLFKYVLEQSEKGWT